MECLIQSGLAELFVVLNQDFSCMLVRNIKHKHFSNTHQLFEANIEWNNIDSSFCKKLSTRLEQKKSKGKAIPY